MITFNRSNIRSPRAQKPRAREPHRPAPAQLHARRPPHAAAGRAVERAEPVAGAGTHNNKRIGLNLLFPIDILNTFFLTTGDLG